MKKFTRLLRNILLFPMMLAFGAVDANMNTLDGNMSGDNKKFYEKALLERLLPNLVFCKYGQKRPVPKNEGDTINFRRFESLPVNTNALTEGITPPGTALSMSTVEAKLKQYGDYSVITDKLDQMGIDPVITEASELHGEAAALKYDTITRNVVADGSNVFYAAGTGREEVGAANILNSALIKKAVRALKRQNVKPFEDGFYIGIIHPDAAYDIQEDQLWQDISKYNGGANIVNGEVGKIHKVKFVESTNAPVFEGAGANGEDVYGTMIIGRDAYGVPELEGDGAPRIIIKYAKDSGTDDPIEQRNTVGYKGCFTAVRLNELAMIRVEHGATV